MTKNMNMQHKKILFMISLPQKNYDDNKEIIFDCISKLRDRDVDIRERISREDLTSINNYDIVIIISHYDKYNGTLVMKDEILHFNDFINSLPENYSGYIDLSFCHSATIKKAVEKRCPYCIVQVSDSEEGTRLDVHLIAYPFVVDHVYENKEKDYHAAYLYVLGMFIEAATKNPKNGEYDDDSLRLGQKKESSEDVKTSVFFPEEVVRGKFYKLQIILHLDVDTGTLYFDIAKGNDPITAKRKTNVALKNVHKGDCLLLNLSFLDGENRRSTKQIIVDERDELTFEDDHYTKGIIVNDEDKTEIPIHVKVNKDYNDIKFFTIIKFIKDDKCLITFDLETGFKTEPFQNDSKEEGKRPVVRSVKSGFSYTPNAKRKMEKKLRETMTLQHNVTGVNLHLFFEELQKKEWIGGYEAHFKALFSGKSDEDCELTWKGKYGNGTLVELFKRLIDSGAVVVPKGFTLSRILEGHFKDSDGKWLTRLDKGDKFNPKADEEIKLCVKLMNTRSVDKVRNILQSSDDDEDYVPKLNPYKRLS